MLIFTTEVDIVCPPMISIYTSKHLNGTSSWFQASIRVSHRGPMMSISMRLIEHARTRAHVAIRILEYSFQQSPTA